MHDMQSAEAALAIEGLSHWYGSRQALDDVTFSLRPATFTVLLGLNGAGKSTLFSLVTRLYAVRRGQIARALLHRPKLLVLDEPTVGLDIKARAELLGHVHGLVAEEGVCVLWATHLVDEIDEVDDVIVLHLGKILAHGPAPGLVAQSGAADIRGAFSALISAAAPGEAA